MADKQALEAAKKVAEMARQISKPSGYAQHRLGFQLHPVQAAVLDAIFKIKSRVVFRCGNEVGKTQVVLCSAILFAIEILEAQVVSTASVSRQVFEQLIPALKRHSFKYDRATWQFQDRAIKRWDKKRNVWFDAYVGFAAEDEHGFQGFHGNPDRPLFIALDEAQGIKRDIANAAEDRCNPDHFLVCGSPGDPQGFFYDCETKSAPHYTHFKLPRMECVKSKGGWVDDADIARMIEKHGRENPFIQSTVFAEFSENVENSLITLSEYDRCMNNPPPHISHQDRHGFCDFAAGRDKNVYARRVGNRVDIRKRWVDRNTMSAVGEFVTMFNEDKKQVGLEAFEISGDADGLGLPMVQRIQEVGWEINEFHGGKPPRFDENYKNQVAEVWGEGCAKIKRCEIILPDSQDLKAQILGRKSKRNSTGKLELESKEDMKKRGLDSPDEADAVLGCMMPAPMLTARQVLGVRNAPARATKDSFWSDPDANQHSDSDTLPGVHMG